MDRLEAERAARLAAETRLASCVAQLAASEARLMASEARLKATSAELAAADGASERAGRAKTAFLANMSHEIRTPVAAVMGYANLIAATEQAHSETRVWSQRLQRSAEHLLALLDDVLDLAKIDAGRLDLHRVPVEPSTVLEEVGVLMEPRAVERGLELIVVCDTELPARFRTDPLRLRQILVNLVGNALKYTREGKVELRASMHDAAAGTPELAFAVIDSGEGIAEDDLERLFQPFEQGQRERPRAGGVGLGLDIARRLARMLGGDIAVRSQVGSGSTFTLRLPVAEGLGGHTTPARLVTRSGVLRPEEVEAARLDGRVVLLVDDTEDNRRIVAHFLGQAGARVVEAESLAEASARLSADPGIGLVLTDLQLPDGDGLELVTRLRADGDRRPMVALTADALVETRMRALSQGVDDFIVKPIIGHRLVARLAALFTKVGSGDQRPAAAPSLAEGTAEPEGVSAAAQSEPVRVVTAQHPRPRAPVPEMPADLLRRFYVVLAERIYVMEDAIRAKDRTRLAEVAHRVAGAGGAMGHPELTELGRAVEAAVGQGQSWEALEPTALRFLGAAREAATRRPWAR